MLKHCQQKMCFLLLRELFFFNVSRGPHQIRAENFQMYILIYRLVLRLIFHFLWQSETTQNNYKKFVSQKQGKITTENIAYFPYQKSESQKQRKFTTKNLVCFSYQKLTYFIRCHIYRK